MTTEEIFDLPRLYWHWDHCSDTWMYGDSNDGCGVFYEGGTWWGNVVIGRDIQCVGPYPDCNTAKVECLNHYRKSNHEASPSTP